MKSSSVTMSQKIGVTMSDQWKMLLHMVILQNVMHDSREGINIVL